MFKHHMSFIASFATGLFLMLAFPPIAGPAFSQTAAPLTRSPDAINADWQQNVSQLRDAIRGGQALQSADSRKKAAPQVVAVVNKLLALLDEMSAAQPSAKAELDGTAIQFRVLAVIVGDPAQFASLSETAAGSDLNAIRAKAALAIANYVKAADDAGKNRALDVFDVALHAAPGDTIVFGLISMTSLSKSPSKEIDQHLLNIVKNDAQGPDAEQMALELESHIKLKGMENKPLVIEGIALTDPNFSTVHWKGKVILVDFWATWCGPCMAELPRVNKMYSDYHANGLEVLGISCDNSGDDLRKFLAQNPSMSWPQLFDDRTPGWHPLATSYGIISIPKLFLIDRKGVLRSVDARSQMEDLIPTLLEEQP